jgi:hypothetical protein
VLVRQKAWICQAVCGSSVALCVWFCVGGVACVVWHRVFGFWEESCSGSWRESQCKSGKSDTEVGQHSDAESVVTAGINALPSLGHHLWRLPPTHKQVYKGVHSGVACRSTP